MKLLCPKCNSEISGKGVNFNEGIAHCSNCNEYFKLADHIRDLEVHRIPQPLLSRVTTEIMMNEYQVTIPPGGFNRNNFPLLLFCVLWNSFFFIFQQGSGGFIFAFLLGDIMMICFFLYSVFNKTIITFSRTEIVVKDFVFSLFYTRKRHTAQLVKISEEVVYTQNYSPVYGICFQFKHQDKLKFGSRLTAEERKWLIGEFNFIKNKLGSANKR